MNLSAPKQLTFWITVIIAIIALLVRWAISASSLSPYSFTILLIAFIVLALGNLIKGL